MAQYQCHSLLVSAEMPMSNASVSKVRACGNGSSELEQNRISGDTDLGEVAEAAPPNL